MVMKIINLRNKKKYNVLVFCTFKYNTHLLDKIEYQRNLLSPVPLCQMDARVLGTC